MTTGIGTQLIRGSLAAAGLLATTAIVEAADVTYERLLNPEPGNWLTYGRTYDSHRYSPLDEINAGNVGGLHVAFMLPLAPPEQGGFAISSLHATPLVDDGMMYMVDGWGRVYGIDLTAGDRAFIRWIMDPATARDTDGIVNNRGAALLGDTVYSITLDGYLMATNSATGELMWAAPTEDNPVEYFTMAPLALEDEIIIGPAGGDGPMRGRLEARSPVDGSLIWTFHTIPGAGEPGYETWAPGTAEVGGGAVWATGSYDPSQNLLVWGIGNPQPDFDPSVRAGDNLYTDSSVALNADTGELVWYFQYTPNDSWDYDEVGTQLLVDVDGRATLGHFGRNGFFYTLNATNGEFINGAQYVDQLTWTAGLDTKTGKPIEYDPNLGVQVYNTQGNVGGEVPGFGGAPMTIPARDVNFCPYWEGGVNFYPTSYSPATGLAYGAAMEGCNDFSEGFANFGQIGGVTGGTPLTGSVTAIDVATGAIVAKHSMPYVGRGGVLSTAGGLVFSASINGDFFALDDDTMDVLWNFNVGTGIEAPPISFAVNGKQYIAVAVGPGGVGAVFHNYAEHGDDPNAPAMANAQSAAYMVFFAL
jgi:alcohol dehydrogenase (cytochrome c)